MPKKISDLTAKTTLNNTDSFPLSDAVLGADRRITRDSLKTALGIDDLEESQQAGVIGYADKTTMDADTTQTSGTIAQVTNDTTASNNGYYRWNGTSWVKRADFYATTLNPEDTTEAVTGKAVGEYKRFPLSGRSDDIQLMSRHIKSLFILLPENASKTQLDGTLKDAWISFIGDNGSEYIIDVKIHDDEGTERTYRSIKTYAEVSDTSNDVRIWGGNFATIYAVIDWTEVVGTNTLPKRAGIIQEGLIQTREFYSDFLNTNKQGYNIQDNVKWSRVSVPKRSPSINRKGERRILQIRDIGEVTSGFYDVLLRLDPYETGGAVTFERSSVAISTIDDVTNDYRKIKINDWTVELNIDWSGLEGITHTHLSIDQSRLNYNQFKEEQDEVDAWNFAKSAALFDSFQQVNNRDLINPNKIPLGSYSWWCRPTSIQRVEGAFNVNYLSYVTSFGDQVIVRLLIHTDNRINTEFRVVSPKIPFRADEHNPPAINFLSNGDLITAYTGNYDDYIMYVRKGNNLRGLSAPMELRSKSNLLLTYTQILVYEENVYIISRLNGYQWGVWYSEDSGETWSENKFLLWLGSTAPRPYIIHSEAGRYAKFYFYPSADETTTYIKYFELDLQTGDVREDNNTPPVGSIKDVSWSRLDMNTFGKQIFSTTENRIRLLDGSANLRNKALCAINTLYGLPEEDNNGMYKIIEYDFDTDSQNVYDLAEIGKEIINLVSDYPGGMYLEQDSNGNATGNVYLSRFGIAGKYNYNPVDDNKWRIEKWSWNGAGYSFDSLIEESDETLFRPAPPFNVGGISLSYMKGVYRSFTRFVTDIKFIK